MSLILLVAASMFLGASASIIQNHTETSSVIDGEEACRSDQIEVKIGDNPLYCKWIGFPDSSELVSLEVINTFAIRFEDDVWVETYRWEDVDESIVYGFIEDGTYFCERLIPEFSLEEDWKVESMVPLPTQSGAAQRLLMKKVEHTKRVLTPTTMFGCTTLPTLAQ